MTCWPFAPKVRSANERERCVANRCGMSRAKMVTNGVSYVSDGEFKQIVRASLSGLSTSAIHPSNGLPKRFAILHLLGTAHPSRETTPLCGLLRSRHTKCVSVSLPVDPGLPWDSSG